MVDIQQALEQVHGFNPDYMCIWYTDLTIPDLDLALTD